MSTSREQLSICWWEGAANAGVANGDVGRGHGRVYHHAWNSYALTNRIENQTRKLEPHSGSSSSRTATPTRAGGANLSPDRSSTFHCVGAGAEPRGGIGRVVCEAQHDIYFVPHGCSHRERMQRQIWSVVVVGHCCFTISKFWFFCSR